MNTKTFSKARYLERALIKLCVALCQYALKVIYAQGPWKILDSRGIDQDGYNSEEAYLDLALQAEPMYEADERTDIVNEPNVSDMLRTL